MGHFHVDPVELFDSGEVRLDFSSPITGEIDLVGKPLTSVQYEVQTFHESCRPVPLPDGRFDDLRPFVPAPARPGPSLIAEVHPSRIVLSLHEGGGLRYDRPTNTLLLAITRPAERDAVLFSTRVPVSALTKPVEIDLPLTLPDEYEIVSQLLFTKCYWRVVDEN